MKLTTVVFSVAAVRTEKRETPGVIKREIAFIKAGSIKKEDLWWNWVAIFLQRRTSWQVKRE